MAVSEFIEHLEYELRMLLGADQMIKLCALKREIGNPVNYFKDSAYMHTRNLYNFFSNKRNDANVEDFIQYPFDVTVYNKWSDALHSHALHIKSDRVTPSNVVDGQHLNEQVPNFVSDILRLWQDWIDATNSQTDKQVLVDALARAQKEAQDDYDSMNLRLTNV
ncbi:MAG: hypothetical protein JNK26_04085 [Candidatus Doudnabacteria bacterium]|nr:hypothetical protein [Candidatus Doudnabacteria bacterium]